jgi:hypothetical protein
MPRGNACSRVNWMRQVRRSRSDTKARANSIANTGDSLASPHSRYQGPARRQSSGDQYRLTLNCWVGMGQLVLDYCEQGDNRPICVCGNNCKSPDLVRVRGVLYYSSAGFFLLQLEQACSFLPSVCGPTAQRGASCREERRQSLRMGPPDR